MDILYKENAYIKSIIIILTKFLPFRGLELIENDTITNAIVTAYNNEDDIPRTKELIEFNDMALNLIKNTGFFQINAKNQSPRGARDLVTILILSNDDYGDLKKNKTLKKNIDLLDKDGYLDELIIITDKSQFNKKSFIDCIIELKQNEVYRDYSGECARYNAYPSIFFRCDIPNVVTIYPHRIISDQEIERELNSEYILKSNIPTIYDYEPIIIWLGGRCGEVVEIIRNSITIESVYYRLIKSEIYKPEKVLAKLKK